MVSAFSRPPSLHRWSAMVLHCRSSTADTLDLAAASRITATISLRSARQMLPSTGFAANRTWFGT
jgi:hypothetical protein